jgi:histidyl-tRNA synthetase
MPFSTQPYKGTRDFYPEDLAKRNYIFDTWKKVLNTHGFAEYDTSILENADLYLAKSGEELGSKQLYAFEDKGGRKVALRPEMTPSLARIVAGKFGELKFPIRWFSIPNCFRYERPQKGRTREFWQLNFDIIGAEAGETDLELMYVLGRLFLAFGAKKEMFSIRYSHRKALDNWIEKRSLTEFKTVIYAVLDDWRKTDEGKKQEMFEQAGLSLAQIKIIFETAEQEILEEVSKFPEIRLIQEILPQVLPEVKYQFDFTIVRGLAYYTGLVFEAFDENPENNRAMFGAGRYDDLLSLFGKQSPAVGVGVGDLTWHEFLEGWNLYPQNLLNEEKVGIIVVSRESLNLLYLETLPGLVSQNKQYEINYEYQRSENKRFDTLKKRGCSKIIKV